MNTKADNDRRNYSRVLEKIEISITYKEKNGAKQATVNGKVADISPTGVSFFTESPLPALVPIKIEFKLPEPYGSVKSRAKLSWRDDRSSHYGAQFVFNDGDRLVDLEKFLDGLSSNTLGDRRRKDQHQGRRMNLTVQETAAASAERRRIYRRISDLLELKLENGDSTQGLERLKAFQRAKGLGYTHEAVRMQREWLSQHTGVSLKHISVFSEDPRQMQGNIENLIGVAHVPIGIAGPLRINGDYARGIYYVPLATTEGSLVISYTLSMTIIARSGGINTKVLNDEMHISPVFIFDSLKTASRFAQWVNNNFLIIKREAEKTTRYGKLIRVEPRIFNKYVILKFSYHTGDAMGMNMINIATERACKLIVSTVKPEKFYIRSNFSSDKKVTAHNFICGKGKTVVAEATIPRKQIERFNTTPEELETYFHTVLFTSIHAGMIGMNAQIANTIAAMFIACGQDVANVANSFVGNTTCEVTKSGDLYVSVYLPSLILGTVGGGTNLSTQQECLKIIGCDGEGKSRKLAEIVAATALAGEFAIGLAIVSGTFVSSHATFGRKKVPHS